ncbi:hypothetical protein [Thiohalocapsa sp. ML1]|jgi:hypothetical protein|uniref:hypothetical protein n=1 Tax=Thiohalocapsa sp. ML1 TaxID=1431688 RepID=UPI000731F0EA|nr:hypothetical protein [Thiohalocapsa sp. ML1]
MHDFEQRSLFDDKSEDDSEYTYEQQVDCLIEVMGELATSARRPIFDKLFKSVVREWKMAEPPDPEEGITNAWEFLGVINYHGSDHGLCEFTISELQDTVERKIRDLPLHERILFNLANTTSCHDWDDFKRGFTSTRAEDVLNYLSQDEPLEESSKVAADTIRSRAPVYHPYD